jgi:hypothetical protein
VSRSRIAPSLGSDSRTGTSPLAYGPHWAYDLVTVNRLHQIPVFGVISGVPSAL